MPTQIEANLIEEFSKFLVEKLVVPLGDGQPSLIDAIQPGCILTTPDEVEFYNVIYLFRLEPEV